VSYTFDANVLLYASDEASRYHEPARAFLARVARDDDLVYLFWPTALAYLRIATHPAVFERPLARADAIANIDALVTLPHVRATGEHERFWASFRHVADDADARGNLVPDAHLAALMLEHGVRTIWTHDRDFRRFGSLEVRDPFA
jgi:uncharacterized protein